MAMTAAANAIAPKMKDDVEAMQWESTNKPVSDSTINYGAQELDVVVKAISRCDPIRAGSVLSKFLNDKSNVQLKDKVVQSITDEDYAVNSLVRESIKESLAVHNKRERGRRTKAEEAFVKHVTSACMFKMVKECNNNISTNALAKAIGVSWHQANIARNSATDMVAQVVGEEPFAGEEDGWLLVDANNTINEFVLSTRSDYIQEKLEPYVFAFLLDDEFTRLDTNASPAKQELIHPSTGQPVSIHKRIWHNVDKRQQHLQFQNSKYLTEFHNDHGSEAKVCYETWRRVLSKVNSPKFVSNPSSQSCVDEKMSGLEHAIAAILHALKLPRVKAELENSNAQGLTYDETLELFGKRCPRKVIKAICCPEVEQPDLHVEGIEECPRMMPFNCTHGDCRRCGLKRKLGILKKLKKCQSANVQVSVNVWKDSPRQGMTNGKQNTQRELVTHDMSIKKLTQHFKDLSL